MKRTARLPCRRFAAIAAAVIALGTSGSDAASLRTQVVVHGDIVRLGDIFQGAGKYADAELFRAPAPGRSIVLNGKWLHQVARSYDLAWHPGPGLDESLVQRSSNRVGPDLIAKAVSKALETRVAATMRYEVTLDNPNQEIHLPVRMPATLAVRNLFFDPRSNRFSATLLAPDDRPGGVALQIAGRVHEMIEVPVLNRRFRSGEIIRENDLDARLLRKEQVSRNALSAPEQIVGKSARRTLSDGKPLTSADIRQPQLVSRGSMVVMHYRTANMVITAHGTARENGTTGDTVRIRNVNSGKIVEAIVTGPDTVAVMPLTAPRRN
jgi:flagella basal body P-ring formation protein FlgA